MHHDLLAPELNFRQVIPFNQLEYGHDLKFAMKKYKAFQFLDLAVYFSAVMDETKFQTYLSKLYINNESPSGKQLIGGLMPSQSPKAVIQLNQNDALA